MKSKNNKNVLSNSVHWLCLAILFLIIFYMPNGDKCDIANKEPAPTAISNDLKLTHME